MMRNLVFVLLLLAVGARVSFSAAIIDATFDAQPLGPLQTQPHTSPQPLSLPAVILRDTASDRVDVANAVGNFTSKVLLLDATPGNLAAAGFYNPVQYTNGIYSISWDSLITQPAIGIAGNFVALVSETSELGAPVIIGIAYDPSGSFKIGNFAPGSSHLAGSYSIGIRQHFEFLLDLNAHTYDLSVDGSALASGPLFDSSGFNVTVFDALARGDTGDDPPPFAVDNIRVEQVPEPHTVLLNIAACAALFGRRRQRRG
jgi:hypothetical protein